MNGHSINGWDYYYDYMDLENCKMEFKEVNEDRSLDDGIIFPDHPLCRVKPRGKVRSIPPMELLTLSNQGNSWLKLGKWGGSYVGATGNYSAPEQAQWYIYQDLTQGIAYIQHAESGHFLCIAPSGNQLKACTNQEISSHSYRWKLNIVNDYNFTNGIPTGRSYRIESYEEPGRELYFSVFNYLQYCCRRRSLRKLDLGKSRE